MTQSSDDGVWIEVVSPTYGVGDAARFFGMATISFPHGMNCPAEARVRFNLSGYVRAEIEKALDGVLRLPDLRGGVKIAAESDPA